MSKASALQSGGCCRCGSCSSCAWLQRRPHITFPWLALSLGGSVQVTVVVVPAREPQAVRNTLQVPAERRPHPAPAGAAQILDHCSCGGADNERYWI